MTTLLGVAQNIILKEYAGGFTALAVVSQT